MKRLLIQGFILLLVFVSVINLNFSGAIDLDKFHVAENEKPVFLNVDTTWVDSVLNSLNLDEKIAQLLMVASYSYMGEEHLQNISDIISKYNVGGIIFMKGSPVRQALMTNHYQALAKTPLMVAMDAEWGLAMRLDSTVSYPRQMMLGAITDQSLIYQMGYDIGNQLRRLGVHVNFAPVADINNNPLNPVINSRSFGENKKEVASRSFMYAQGLQDAGVIAVYKHFPGHGDTDSDSHYSLPVIKHDRDRLDSLELYPFKAGIGKGIQGIMTAHLQIPALDSTPDLASSLSKKIVTEELIHKMGFSGLIFTDALGMKGVSDYYKPGEVEAQAFVAGNDILLMPEDVPRAISMIKREIKRDRVSEEELDRRCRKILMAKYWLGLNKPQMVRIDSLYEDLNDPFYEVEKDKFISNAVTLVKNQSGLLPLKHIENYSIASISIGSGKTDEFGKSLVLYKEMDDYYVSAESLSRLQDSLYRLVKKYNTVIISIQETSQWPARNYGIYPSLNTFLKELEYNGNLILGFFGNPYGLARLDGLEKFNAVFIGYEDIDEVKKICAQAVFGAREFRGKLPVSITSQYNYGKGLLTDNIHRLSYGIPESVMMSSDRLARIDSIVGEAIRMKATPGCQVLVSRHSRVIFNKSYGFQTYGNKIKVSNDQIYDLASITKIAATLPSLMKLEDEGRFSTENRLGDYLNFPDTCNKKDLLIKDILAHQSGLVAWIPFYYKTLEPMDTSENLLSSKFSYEYPYKIGNHAYVNRNIRYRDSVFNCEYSDDYPILVANKLYLRKDYRDSVYLSILNSELQDKTYRYSDLGYYLFQEVIENEKGIPLYPLVFRDFYSRLGAEKLCFLPLNRYPAEMIVPTENDLIFRRQLLRGFVHDPGAAMLGGISGHAGLFSNANDLAKFMQMYLNKGEYGGTRFLSDSVVTRYTARVFSDNGNRRALGFDKPEPDPDKIGPTCESVSLASYGHTGFTGTMAWVDPEYDLIYIFLSNRIHPNQYNSTLISENIRTQIQQAIYDSILDQPVFKSTE